MRLTTVFRFELDFSHCFCESLLEYAAVDLYLRRIGIANSWI